MEVMRMVSDLKPDKVWDFLLKGQMMFFEKSFKSLWFTSHPKLRRVLRGLEELSHLNASWQNKQRWSIVFSLGVTSSYPFWISKCLTEMEKSYQEINWTNFVSAVILCHRCDCFSRLHLDELLKERMSWRMSSCRFTLTSSWEMPRTSVDSWSTVL